ncbi:hypothetical protein GKC32_01285 [Lactobacillus curvatus]|nr:hypothetical protein [Latilactobacillus curvatus]MSE23107.1 hypothetical protein [Latilactobacillus curvatus]
MEKVATLVEMVATAVAEPFTFGADMPLFAVEGGQFAAGLAAFAEEFGAKMATKESLSKVLKKS